MYTDVFCEFLDINHFTAYKFVNNYSGSTQNYFVMDVTFIINCLETNNLDLIDIDPGSMCRTCTGTAGTDARSVFESTFVLKNAAGHIYHIFEIVQLLTRATIRMDDGLPQTMCRPCVKQFFTAYNFISQAQKIDSAFRKYLKSNNPDAAAEPDQDPMEEIIEEDAGEQDEHAEKEEAIPVSIPVSKTIKIEEEPNQTVTVLQNIQSQEEEEVVTTTKEPEPEADIEIHYVDNQVDEEPEDTEVVETILSSPTKSEMVEIIDSESSPTKQSPRKRRATANPIKSTRSPSKRSVVIKEALASEPQDTAPPAPAPKARTKRTRTEKLSAPPIQETLATFMRQPQYQARKYQCTLCPKSYSHTQALNRHMGTEHGTGDGQAKKECPYCPRVFNRADGLTKHIRTHTNERPYSCKFCDKKFKQGGELKEHIRTHTKDVLYRCGICGKTMTTRMGYYYHMKSHDKKGTVNEADMDILISEEAVNQQMALSKKDELD